MIRAPFIFTSSKIKASRKLRQVTVSDDKKAEFSGQIRDWSAILEGRSAPVTSCYTDRSVCDVLRTGSYDRTIRTFERTLTRRYCVPSAVCIRIHCELVKRGSIELINNIATILQITSVSAIWWQDPRRIFFTMTHYLLHLLLSTIY